MGISYTSQIKVLHKEHPLTHNSPYVYTKRLANYKEITSSPSTSYTNPTLVQQQTRRNRVINRMFRSDNLPLIARSNPHVLRQLGLKHHRLVTCPQYMYNHIRHIKLHKFLQKPEKLFPLPQPRSRHTHRIKPMQEIELELVDITNSTSPDTTFSFPSSASPSSQIPIDRETQILERRAMKAQLAAEYCAARKQRPPLTSLQSASVGFSRRRNFVQEITDEYLNIQDSCSDRYPDKVHNFSVDSAETLTDLQDNFHAYMTDSPITTLASNLRPARKRWIKSHRDGAPTLFTLQRRFFGNLFPREERYRPATLPVFPLPSYKRSASMAINNNVIKRCKLLLE
ncbi:hypothetical protein C1645_872167 [Glomus cerebriforme]|uniref:DUF8211 domain-containing protein n=1 Tax=Glomus cerebriforme TaxID=658196 RepID=A0A397TIL5_9GLOM|nr:hypothetical protein C1645_872167 [Glomus cerebriforme]